MRYSSKATTLIALLAASTLALTSLTLQTSESNASNKNNQISKTETKKGKQAKQKKQNKAKTPKTFTYPEFSLYETSIDKQLFDNITNPFIVQTKGNDKKNKHKFTVTAITDDTIKIQSNRNARILLNLVKTKDKTLKQNHKKIVKLKKGSNIVSGLESGRTYQVKYGFDKKTKKYRLLTRITPIKQATPVDSAFIERIGDNQGVLVKSVAGHWSMGAEANRKIFWRVSSIGLVEQTSRYENFEVFSFGESHSTRNTVSLPDKGFLQVDFVVANPLAVQTQRMWSVAPVEVIKSSGASTIFLSSVPPDMSQFTPKPSSPASPGSNPLASLIKTHYDLGQNYFDLASFYAKRSFDSASLALVNLDPDVTFAQNDIDLAWFWFSQGYYELMIVSFNLNKGVSAQDNDEILNYKLSLESKYAQVKQELEQASMQVVKAWTARSVQMLNQSEQALNTNQSSTVVESFANEALTASLNAEKEAGKLNESQTGTLLRNLELDLITPISDTENLLNTIEQSTSLTELLNLSSGAAQLAYSTYILQLGREGLDQVMNHADSSPEADPWLNQTKQADELLQELFQQAPVEPFKTSVESYLTELIDLVDKANEHYGYLNAYDAVRAENDAIQLLHEQILDLETKSLTLDSSLPNFQQTLDLMREKTLTMRDHIRSLENQDQLINSNSRHKLNSTVLLSSSQEVNDDDTVRVNKVVKLALDEAIQNIVENNTTAASETSLPAGALLHELNNSLRSQTTELYGKKLDQNYNVSADNLTQLEQLGFSYKLAIVGVLTGDVHFEKVKAENTSKAKDARVNVIASRGFKTSINSIVAELSGSVLESSALALLDDVNVSIAVAEDYAMASQVVLNQTLDVLTEVAVNRDDDVVWFTFDKNVNDTREAIDYQVEVVRSGESVVVSFTESNGNFLQDLGDGVVKVNVKTLPGSVNDGVFFRLLQESWERSTENPTRVDPVDVDVSGLLTMQVSSSDNYTCETVYAPGVLDGSECVETKNLSYETRAYTYPTMNYTYSNDTEYMDYTYTWTQVGGGEPIGEIYIDRSEQFPTCPDGWNGPSDFGWTWVCHLYAPAIYDNVKNPTPAGWSDNGSRWFRVITVKDATPVNWVDDGSKWVSLTQATPPSSGASIDSYFTDSGFTDNGTQYVAKSPRPASIHNNAGLGIFYSYVPAVNKYQAKTQADRYSTYKPVFSSLPSTVLSWEAGSEEFKVLEGSDTGRNSIIVKVYTLTGVKYVSGSTDPAPRRP